MRADAILWLIICGTGISLTDHDALADLLARHERMLPLHVTVDIFCTMSFCEYVFFLDIFEAPGRPSNSVSMTASNAAQEVMKRR
jgi:hypothetical protein